MKNTIPDISVVICTYNRSDVLRLCLDSLACLDADSSEYEIIVIDNNSSDDTYAVASGYVEKYPNICVYKELKQGLSAARNRGYGVSNAPWIAYIDDDVKVDQNFITRIRYIIEHYDFDCFGGVAKPWFRRPTPHWMQRELAKKKKIDQPRYLNENEYFSGFCAIFKKELLEQMGGFSETLGMKAETVAYGEETFLQRRARQAGLKIGLDSELIVEHLVNDDRLTPTWYIKSYFAHGKNSWEIFEDKSTLFSLLKVGMKMLGSFLKNIFIYTPRLCIPNYYKQNWLIDVMSMPALYWGRLWQGITANQKNVDGRSIRS